MSAVTRAACATLKTFSRSSHCLSSRILQTTPSGSRGIKRWLAPVLKEMRARNEQLKFQNVKPIGEVMKKRSNYLEWNRPAELYAFSARLSENIDEALLDGAFTHRSHILAEEAKQKALGIENPEIMTPDNRDLVFEGERFIREYVTAYLKAMYPRLPEAGILAIRDHLLSRKMLAEISTAIGTPELILSQEYPPDEEIVADVFKAVVAALLRSSGEERASFFVRDFVVTQLNGVDVNELWKIDNPVEMLRDILKEKGLSEPEPRLLSEVGRNTLLACFRVGFYVDRKLVCSGYGETEEIAVEMAARDGLMRLFGTEDNASPPNFKLDLVMRSADGQKRIESSNS